MSSLEDLRRWIVANKLKAVGTIWLSSIAGSLAYQWYRPIPPQLKARQAESEAVKWTWTGAAGLEAPSSRVGLNLKTRLSLSVLPLV